VPETNKNLKMSFQFKDRMYKQYNFELRYWVRDATKNCITVHLFIILSKYLNAIH